MAIYHGYQYLLSHPSRCAYFILVCYYYFRVLVYFNSLALSWRLAQLLLLLFLDYIYGITFFIQVFFIIRSIFTRNIILIIHYLYFYRDFYDLLSTYYTRPVITYT